MRILIVIFLASLFFLGCGSFISEPTGCEPARERVRGFYSIRLDAAIQEKPDISARQAEFLTDSFKDQIEINPNPETDYFFESKEVPTAFRVGECTKTDAGFSLQVLLFWKSGDSKKQQEMKVDTRKENGDWRIDSIEKTQ